MAAFEFELAVIATFIELLVVLLFAMASSKVLAIKAGSGFAIYTLDKV